MKGSPLSKVQNIAAFRQSQEMDRGPKNKDKSVMKESLNDWYAGRSVFVTGGSGFMGKVLLEKLLRCLPDLHKVYVLIRSKRGATPATRLQQLLQLPVFEKLRTEEPITLQKLVAVEGDIMSEGLGLSPASLEMLARDVSVVIHAAASLKLEANLRDALDANTLSTDRVMSTCLQMPNLEAVVHLSTAFCHCDMDVMEERAYPPPHDYRDIQKMLNIFDNDDMEVITPKIIFPHVNCYTYTKRLAEGVVQEYSSRLPVVIVRPSVVIPALREPIAGWVDSLNGPVGILVAGGKGVLRSMLGNSDYNAEVIPVDIAINGIISIAKCRATQKSSGVPTYNLTQGDVVPITWGEVISRGQRAILKYPLDWPVWYPGGSLRTNYLLHHIIVFLFHKIPAYFIDFMMILFMQKTFMVRLQNKISVGLESLQFFTTRNWKFENKKFMATLDDLNDNDKETFYTYNIKFDKDTYILTTILGAKKYCLKENLANLPIQRIYIKFLYILDCIVKSVFYYYLAYYFLSCFGSSHLLTKNYWSNILYAETKV